MAFTDMQKLVAEFVGTYMLVFTVGCNVLGGSGAWAAVSIASVLMVMIYALGGISGANFNPAVSLAIGLSKHLGGEGMEWKEVGMYCGTQLAAGICAGFSYFMLFGKPFNLAPVAGHSILAAGVCELLYTFILCFVVLNVAVAKKNKTEGGQYFGLAIGYVIVAGAYGAGAVSGGCFNPAVAFGIDTSSAQLGFGVCLVYTAFELVGAVLATLAFLIVRPEDFGGEKADYVNLVAEFIGTFVLVLTVGLNVLGKSSAAAFSIAASLMCMIYSLGDVSGANFNPAVTTTLVACGKMQPVDAAKYIVAQLLGGIVAGFTYTAIYSGTSFPLGPVGSHTLVEAAVAEIVFTFVLCFVVMGAAVSEKTKTTQFFGLAIGSCVTVGGLAIGGISGGSLNPAVSFGIATAHSLKSPAVLGTAAMYSLFEFLGSGVAAGTFMATHKDADVDAEKAALVEKATA
eukprot:TRINITY_DN2514_c0_g1_i2.p1 TRINITY_DN2514_c0_g1~~TRINITY_DN2514_c0_g1_i2.p1  ORF type:complete len:456 (-),score=143.47 TRINITY_DN2514_c0_g1_i2:119-1486(-)